MDRATGGAGSDRFVFRTGDRDGFTNTITDFTREGDELDRLDLRALNLLRRAETATEWANANMSYADGSVWIDAGGMMIELNDHLELGDAFLQLITDVMEL